MTVPLWTLLGFALWTQLTLLGTIGVYRWSRILTRRADFERFGTPDTEGESELYARAMRAHANCLENLPIYAVVVLALVTTGTEAGLLDVLACVILGARLVHTIIHVAFEQTNPVLVARFGFFAIQFVAMTWMGTYVAMEAA